MRFIIIVSTLVASVCVLAVPTELHTKSKLPAARQAAPIKPTPCMRNHSTTRAQTEDHFNAFAHAFIYKPDISKSFSYIVQDYINHNPAVSNGFDAAWNILSPIWDSQNITALRTTFQYPQGWLNYKSGFGEVVDRFRWDGGCIVEHWDQNEKFPSTAPTKKPQSLHIAKSCTQGGSQSICLALGMMPII